MNKRKYVFRQNVLTLLSVVLIGVLSFTSLSNAQDKSYQAQTTKNVDVHIDELEMALLPLLKSEVEVEVNAWLAILKQKATILSKAEILVSQKQEGIEALGDIAAISEDVVKAKESAQALESAKDKTTEQELKKEVEEDLKQLKSLSTKLEDERATKAVQELADKQQGLDKLAQGAEEYAKKLAKKRNKLINSLTELREEKNAALDRFNVVLKNWEQKGGDAAELKLYAESLSGTTVDLTDGEAAWLTFKGWLKSKEGGLLWLSNIIKFIIALAIVYGISATVGKLTDAALNRNKKLSLLLKNFIQLSVRRVIIGIGFLVSLTIIGINVAPVLALIGAAGLVIGLALQSTLSNFASGMLILIYRPFDVGEVIEIDGVVGTVDSMTLLSTAIKTFDNQHLIVPNNNVWGSTIINVTGSKTRRVDLVFGIGYGDDMDKAQAIMEDVLANNPMVLKHPEAVVKVHELADSSVNFVCRPWVKTADYWDVYWDITRQVKEEFDKQGVSIPFPQRDVHIHQIADNSQ